VIDAPIKRRSKGNRPTTAASDARRLADSTFVVLVNGTLGSPPASGVLEYLLRHEARQVTTVSHPLGPEDGNLHEIRTYDGGRETDRRSFRLLARPPYTYPLDAFLPIMLPRSDTWIALNNLLCWRGLMERAAGRTRKVLYWAVDFVPDRFGTRTPLTRVYDALDAFCCRRVDLRIELSKQALAGRDARHRLDREDSAPCVIAPVGAWVDRAPVAPSDGWRAHRIVFIGHLVERMGVETVLAATALLVERGIAIFADIAGHGPLEEKLRRDAARLGISDHIRFHGFISEHDRLERLLSQASIALAPYNTRVASFTRYADPSKLKSYLAAGLPILLTDVPPTAQELAQHAGARVLADEPAAFAQAIQEMLADPADWQRRRVASRRYAMRFDWSLIVGGVMRVAGLEP
jgi:glycosyltransferase involved in cell wall biosynthesis